MIDPGHALRNQMLVHVTSLCSPEIDQSNTPCMPFTTYLSYVYIRQEWICYSLNISLLLDLFSPFFLLFAPLYSWFLWLELLSPFYYLSLLVVSLPGPFPPCLLTSCSPLLTVSLTVLFLPFYKLLDPPLYCSSLSLKPLRADFAPSMSFYSRPCGLPRPILYPRFCPLG